MITCTAKNSGGEAKCDAKLSLEGMECLMLCLTHSLQCIFEDIRYLMLLNDGDILRSKIFNNHLKKKFFCDNVYVMSIVHYCTLTILLFSF